MSSSYENRKQIVDTWVKLEKCLDEFDAEVMVRKNRPMSSVPAPNKFQISRKRPDSSKLGYNTQANLKRPLTAAHRSMKRPGSGFSIGRPMTGMADLQSSRYGLVSGLNFNKVIHSLPLDHVIALYESRCKDNQVDYLESQAKFFIDKFKVSCGDRVFDMTEHAQVLLSNDEFIKLELGKNNLTDEGLASICQLLLTNRHIIHLNVASNNLTEESAKIISETLLNNNTLISLSLKSFEGLNRNKIGPKGCAYLKKYLTKTKTLMFLDLCAAQIGLLGLKHICESLKLNGSLISLSISHNYLGPNMSKYLAGSLAASCLEELDISYNKLTDHGVTAIAPLFSKINTNNIRKLNLAGNSITSAGLEKLIEQLRENKIIEELILDHNNLSGPSISCLAGLFLETLSLKTFSAERCDLDEFAGESMKVGLARNNTVVELNLRGNSLYDAGCAAVCEALLTNTTIKVLELAENRLREKGGMAIGAMIKKNNTLE